MIGENYRRRIFWLCGKLGLDDEGRRLVQHSVCGKQSLTLMNDGEARMMIDTLKDELRKQSTRRGTQRNSLPHVPNVYNMMTREQRAKVVAMSIQIYGEFSEEKMSIFCRRQFKKPFYRLSAEDAIRLIEIQKDILSRRG